MEPSTVRPYAAALVGLGRGPEAIAAVDAVLQSQAAGLEMAWFRCFAGWVYERCHDIPHATACYEHGGGSGAAIPRRMEIRFLVRTRQFDKAIAAAEATGDRYELTEALYYRFRCDPSFIAEDQQLAACEYQGAYGFASICLQVARLPADRFPALMQEQLDRKPTGQVKGAARSRPGLETAIAIRQGRYDLLAGSFASAYVPDMPGRVLAAIAGNVAGDKDPALATWQRWTQTIIDANSTGNWTPVIEAARNDHRRAAYATLSHALWLSMRGRVAEARAGYDRVLATYDDCPTAYGLATLLRSSEQMRDPQSSPVGVLPAGPKETGWTDLIVEAEPPDEP